MLELTRRLYGSNVSDEQSFLAGYERQNQRVFEHFAERRENLLVMDICGGDGWEVLCPFLGKEPPDEDFPHRR